MDRNPADFAPSGDEAASNADEDARLDAFIAALPPAPGIRHVDEEDDGEEAEALADVAAGRFVPHEKVAEWLKTINTPDFRPMPREWLE